MWSCNCKVIPHSFVEEIKRFLKCQDDLDLDSLDAKDHLIKEFILPFVGKDRIWVRTEEFLNFLETLTPRKVCQYAFKNNDIIRSCRTCQTLNAVYCVLCNECFHGANHEGHDVQFRKYDLFSGCCDCGDTNSVCSEGFCSKHDHCVSDPVSYIPHDLCHVSTVLFDEIAEALLQYGRYIASLYDLNTPRRNRPDDSSTVVMMWDAYHTDEEFAKQLSLADGHIAASEFQSTGSALLQTGNFEVCRSIAHSLQKGGFNVYLGYERDEALGNRMVAAVTFLHELAVRSDGMCQLIREAFDTETLAKIFKCELQLSKEFQKVLYSLLIILVADQQYKLVIAAAYTQAYAKISHLYGRCGLGCGDNEKSVMDLSCQIFSRAQCADEICYGGHDFLKISLAALTSLLEHAQQMSQCELPFVMGNQLSLSMTKALKHNIITKGRYMRPFFANLFVLLKHRRVARFFLSTSLPEFLNLLESFQYVQPQERALLIHVEHEDDDSSQAFLLNFMFALYLFNDMLKWFADPDSSCAMEVSYNGYSSYPDSFTTLRCVEDGWLSPEAQDATQPGKESPSTSMSVRSLMRSLSGRVTQYFNPCTVPSTAASLPYSSGASAAAESSSAKPATAHKLSSAWSVLHTIAERCFAWERRFRDTSGIAVTLPPRERSGSSTYAQYGAGFGEDVQLIDLIQDYALKGVGKLPRLMSFYIPLHRILSHGIFEACKHQHLTACLRSLQGFLTENATSNEVPLSSTIDIPLFCIILSTQINLHMWQRNGQCMIIQANYYACGELCRHFKEMDTLLIQLLLTVHPTDQFVGQLFYRFGVAEYLAHRKITVINVDTSLLPNLVDEALKYIVNLVTELPTPGAAAKDDTDGSSSGGNAKHARPQNLRNKGAGRLLPLVRRELLHKLIGGPATYSQLQECFGIYPEAAKLDSGLIDAIITELTVKHDNILHGAPTYTLKKELWAEYDPCFPRVPGSVHQKAFEDRPKITATAPIVSKPFAAHECFVTVRNHMLLAPVLLRVQRDLLYVAAAERCAKKEVYKAVREKWTLKCNDSIYGKVLQLLTLAIYVTKDMKTATTAAASDDAASSLKSTLYQASAGASTALEKFMLEEIFLPDSESGFNAVLSTVDGTRLPSLLHVLLDIFHANDPLDANSKYWVLWLIEQTSQLSAECALSAEKYRVDNGIITATAGTKAAGGGGVGGCCVGGAAAGSSNNKALSAKEKAMQAMQAKAAQFMMMMEGMSDDSDEEDEDNGNVAKPAVPAKTSTPDQEGSSADGSDTVTPQKDGKAGGAEAVLSDHNASPMPVETPQGGATAEDGDAVPVCIICQADANAEDKAGNMRLLGYLALVQASTLLTHPEGCWDFSTHMRLAETIPSISSKVAPKKLSSECNAQISFCGQGMHYDCFETYLKSQLRKSAEQEDMVLDQTKLQFCCPLCNKLGNLFMPYVKVEQYCDVNKSTSTTQKSETCWNQALMLVCDFSFHVKNVPVQRNENVLRKAQRDVKRKPLCSFLESYMGAVYNDVTFEKSLMDEPSLASFAVVAPFLKVILRSVAYSTSCDLAEHNIPGYHLFPEADLTAALVGGAAATATVGVSGEKAGASTSTAPVDPPSTQAAAVDLSAAPWMYIKKYSLGMDEYRHLEKTVDAVACVLHSFDCLDFVNHSVMVMFGGGVSSQVTALSAELSFSVRAAPTICTTPLLASPLLDMLVLCIALAKAAPAGSPPTSSIVMMTSPKSSRQAQRGPLYHPLWNIEHCCRWICIARLAQLLVLEAEATTVVAERANADPFSAWPSVSPFVNGLYTQVRAGVVKDGKVEAGAESTASITSERAAQIMFQWVTFMRTAMHLVYRTNKALFGQNASSTARPSDWLQCSDVSTSLLVQSAADVTDQQVCRHLTLLGMSELIIDNTPTDLQKDAQSCILITTSRWTSHLFNMRGAVDVGDGASSKVQLVASIIKSQWAALHRDTLRCYPRCSRPSLIALPREYTKLHAMVQSKVSAFRTAQPASTAADSKTAYETPALCLVCAAVLDAAGKGQCAAHTMKCGGEAGVYFLLQECQVLLTHGPRSIYFSSPYVDVYGESQHLFRGKPLLLDARRYEALRHLWSTHRIPNEVALKRSTADVIITPLNYY